MKNHRIDPIQPMFKRSASALLLASLLSACSHPHSDKSEAAIKTPPTAQQDRHMSEESLLQQPAVAMQKHATMGRVANTSVPLLHPPLPVVETNRERYASFDSNPIKRSRDEPVSTFSLDVDSGSYAVVRRHIQHGQLPPRDAVRVEELVNYFNYQYPTAQSLERPFTFDTELSVSPWHPQRQLLRVSLAAWKQPMAQLPPSNLVFLVDVSGSMQAADKLPLLKSSLKLLVQQMRPQDSVSLVTYAGQSAVVLEPTKGDNKRAIFNAIDALGAGGGTHGAAGLKDAYQLAETHKVENGINRVLLATDGDFNVGLSDTESLSEYIELKRKTGISLTTLGFGQGNYNDHLMEQLADKGDGNYAYIDSLTEAKKVLMEQVGATLYTVAKDAKIQVEFNPATVSEYRLIGYENRLLRAQDFSNDKVDAGDIGAGHTVTALYDIALLGSSGEQLPKRRYSNTEPTPNNHRDELAWVKLRYKPHGATNSTLLEHKITDKQVASASIDTRFSSAVAAWGQWLRQDSTTDSLSIKQIIELAESGKGEDKQGYRSEFIQLAKLSASLKD
ncbi:MAG: vWA domain-containing protein [Granulosicoccaceae bacterium]